MPSSPTLTELKSLLTASITGGQLTLGPSSTGVGNVDTFVGSLPAAQLVLSAPQLTLQDQTFPQTLSVAGSVSDHWKIRGLEDDGVAVSAVTLVFTQAQAGAAITGALSAEGSLNIGVQAVALSGVLTAGNSLRFTRQNSNPLSLPLDAVGNFISNSRMSEYLPTGVSIFASVPVTTLEVSFGFAATTPGVLSFTTNVNADWEFISGFTQMKSVGVTLNATYSQPSSAPRLRASFSGNIHGTFHLGRDFEVILALESNNFRELRILPAAGNVLPTLADVAHLVGGNTLRDSVQSGLTALGLGGITLDSLFIGFDFAARTLSYARMNGRIGFAGTTVDIFVRLPDFTFGGSLSEGTPLNLRTLITTCFGSAEIFPDVSVTEFALSAYPSASTYNVQVTIADDAFHVGPVSLKQVSIEIDKTSSGFAGGIGAALNIAGTDVFITASNPGAGAGWRFEGSTGTGQEMSIGALITDLAESVGDITLPPALADLVIENLTVSLDTGTQEFTFGCESKFHVDETDVDITVNVNLKKVGSVYTKDFSGTLRIGELDFTLHFVQNAASDFLVATYHPQTTSQSLSVKPFVESLSSDVAGYVPEGLTVQLKDVLFAYRKVAPAGTQTAASSKFVLGLDIGTGINLSNLPLVGQHFPANATVGVDDLQILFVSQGLTASEVNGFNNLIPDGVTKLPLPPDASTSGTTTAVVIQQGFNVAARLNFGASTRILSLPASGSTTTTTTDANVSTADNARWFTLQKSFGPVYFDKVGVQYRDKKIWFLLSATLTAAGLRLSLDGLAGGGSLEHYTPLSFDLRGIGVGYRSGPVEVTGAFLRQQVTQNNVTHDEYDGAALIKTERLSLSAIGSYAELDDGPSMFVYAVLNYPVGGPSFFFVTGLAAGFGFNRALVTPTIDEVAQFPLVAEAVSGASMPTSLPTELQKLRQYIPLAAGRYFLAVGIKFTSFKLLDSFALLTISFGDRFELNLLGLSTLVVPTPVQGQPSGTPLAQVQMSLKAGYVPDDGLLAISAQLTPASFILSRDCRLTGGFAFWSWFAGAHEGDFALTLGGYHPGYQVPAHYPKVPRLAFNWQVGSNINLKGEMYYALTASTLMAGGSLQATWESDSLKAWFNVGADFVIAWKPYHYDATMYVDIGVSYTYHFFGTHHLTANVGANLHLWGPEFSGTAHIKLSVISFDVNFGSGAAPSAQPIDWATFKASFLPADSQVCSLSLKDGLTTASAAGWIVNPKTFTLVSNSIIPATEAYAGATAIAGAGGNAPLGIAPMAVNSYVARHTINITKNGASRVSLFEFVPVRKKAPAALWGRSFTPALNGAAFVENALAGFEIRPAVAPLAGTTAAIDPGVLQYSSEEVNNAFHWEEFDEFVAGTGHDAARTQAIKNSLASSTVGAARAQLLSAFGLTATVTVTSAAADALLAAPQTGTLAA